MTVIRPNLPGPAHAAPQPQRLDEAKLAAQRAFFAAAFGQAQAPASVAAPEPAAAAPAAPPRMAAETPAEPPKKILRPGSLLDIRV